MKTRTLRLSKDRDGALHRYVVHVDEVRLGWVCRSIVDGTWSAHAKVDPDAFTAPCVGRGESLRRHAVREVLYAVERRGGVWELDDQCHPTFVDVDPGVLLDAHEEVSA